eukprot:2104041-Rhodomonas_salina.3
MSSTLSLPTARCELTSGSGATVHPEGPVLYKYAIQVGGGSAWRWEDKVTTRSLPVEKLLAAADEEEGGGLVIIEIRVMYKPVSSVAPAFWGMISVLFHHDRDVDVRGLKGQCCCAQDEEFNGGMRSGG